MPLTIDKLNATTDDKELTGVNSYPIASRETCTKQMKSNGGYAIGFLHRFAHLEDKAYQALLITNVGIFAVNADMDTDGNIIQHDDESHRVHVFVKDKHAAIVRD